DNLTVEDGLAGFSCGAAVTSGEEPEFDFSADRRRVINTKRETAIYEQFSFGEPPNDLAFSTESFAGTFQNFSDFWAEPNDSQRRARRVFLPFDSRAINRLTEIEPIGDDVDFFDFRAEEGTTVIAEIANAGFDTVIGLFDPDGNMIAFDDDGGAGLLSRIVAPIPETGKYAIAISSFGDPDFSGDGAEGGRYILELSEIEGTLLALGDDDSEEVPLDFTFEFNGVDYDSVFVNSNGNLTFGSGDTDFTESVAELLGDQPRIAPLWDDLSPNQSGTVVVDGDNRSFSVTFEGVPEFFAATGNTFTVMLDRSGDVDISYGDVAAADGIVGVTEGGGAADPGETDFSLGGPLSVTGTTYEQFTFGDEFDLDNEALSFN
ncbi:MAG: PPC domain-containing protein, partial [Pseudomonadota bacterium]